VVGLDVVDLTERELRQEVLQLRRRVQKLSALLRLALALLRTSGFRLTWERLPDGCAKIGFCAPWIGPASFSHWHRSCGSSVCRRVGSTPGGSGSAPVRRTICPPVLAHRRLDWRRL